MLALAHIFQVDGVARAVLGKLLLQHRHIGDVCAVDGNNDVALLQTRLTCRRAVLHLGDIYALVDAFEALLRDKLRRYLDNRDAKVCALHRAVLHDVAHDFIDDGCRNCERTAYIRTVGRVDSGVDTYKLAA